MRADYVAVRGFNFKLMTYQKVISAPLIGWSNNLGLDLYLDPVGHFGAQCWILSMKQAVRWCVSGGGTFQAVSG